MLRYASDAKLLKDTDITIGVGESSYGTSGLENAVKLAKKLDVGLLHYPGSHN